MVVTNSLYGNSLYGSEFYGYGNFPTSYLYGTVGLFWKKNQYLFGNVIPELFRGKYFSGNVNLINPKIGYFIGSTVLEASKSLYFSGNVSFLHKFLPYEVDEFQAILDRQKVKFYWKDSVPLVGKEYNLYESSDSGLTWIYLITTTNNTYEIDIPFDILNKSYKVVISRGSHRSIGFLTYPSYSFRRTLNYLDNGYWDIDPNSNIYKLFEGITKESFCRTELETNYTYIDSSITKIRSTRISNVYGKVFEQESSTTSEEYKRKIWNLFIGFRNTTTYYGLYHIVKAFTGIPPKISKLSDDGWVLGKSILNKDTVPMSFLTNLYGVSFKTHLPKQLSGSIISSSSLSTWDTTAAINEQLNPIANFYKDNFLVFKSGNNTYKSRKVLNYSYNTGIGSFTTVSFPSDSTAGDLFFISSSSTDEIEKYIKKAVNLHSFLLFKYYPDYITENYKTGFSGSLQNLEQTLVSSLKVTNVNTYLDTELITQAKYESSIVFSRLSQLSNFGTNGIVCWDSIEWGDSDINFEMYMTFSDDTTSNNWVYQSDVQKYIKFSNVIEENFEKYIKENSELVYDSSGNTYIKDIDYSIDYSGGTIRRTITSSIPTTSYVSVKYDIEWGIVKQNQSINFTKNYFKYKFLVSNIRNTEDFEFLGFYIKKF